MLLWNPVKPYFNVYKLNQRNTVNLPYLAILAISILVVLALIILFFLGYIIFDAIRINEYRRRLERQNDEERRRLINSLGNR